MRLVPKLHDKSRFKVYVYVVKHDQVVAALDKERSGLADATLVDAHAAEMSDLAKWINEARTHVVIDCNGQTGRESLPALAMRPAALHVHYLGFPSTIGATYIDHIIGDPVVSPPEFVGYYTEKLLLLPNTFQVTSHAARQQHPFADGRVSPLPDMISVGYVEGEEQLRAYHGYPERGPLLCNWNQHFKLDPEFFAVWANIIKRVPNSTLIMLRYPEESEPHLRFTARQTGLIGDQLKFLPKASLTEHLQRTSFCDLFLDNREYNSGTTCTDSLWAGVPTITMPRMKHAGRHAVSMLRAVGGYAQILQARNEKEYEDYAVQLLLRPHKWKQVHTDVVRSRGTGAGEEEEEGGVVGVRGKDAQSLVTASHKRTSTLWTPARWVRDVERALIMAWQVSFTSIVGLF